MNPPTNYTMLADRLTDSTTLIDRGFLVSTLALGRELRKVFYADGMVQFSYSGERAMCLRS